MVVAVTNVFYLPRNFHLVLCPVCESWEWREYLRACMWNESRAHLFIRIAQQVADPIIFANQDRKWGS